jgi:hypothetical protein
VRNTLRSVAINVISGGPRFKHFEGPLLEVPKAQVECRICTNFLVGPWHAHPENDHQGMLTKACSPGIESRLSEMPFPGLWGEILQNYDGQKLLYRL